MHFCEGWKSARRPRDPASGLRPTRRGAPAARGPPHPDPPCAGKEILYRKGQGHPLHLRLRRGPRAPSLRSGARRLLRGESRLRLDPKKPFLRPVLVVEAEQHGPIENLPAPLAGPLEANDLAVETWSDVDLGTEEPGSSVFLHSALLPEGGVLDARQVGGERTLRPSIEGSRHLVLESFVGALVVVDLSKAIETILLSKRVTRRRQDSKIGLTALPSGSRTSSQRMRKREKASMMVSGYTRVPSLVLKCPLKSTHQVSFGPLHDANG